MRHGSGKDRAFAKLIKAYAVAVGCSVRTAQRHAKQDHPDWVAFVQGEATGVVASRPEGEKPTEEQVTALASMSPLQPAELPAELDRPNRELSEPEMVVKNLWDMWASHFGKWREAMKNGNHELALAHAAATLKIREGYEKALQKYTAYEIEQRRLIPVAEFAALRAEFIIPIGNALRSMPQELAVAVNPKDPNHAREKLAEYLQSRLQPLILNLLTEVDNSVLQQAA